jgi:hypothetical protein
MLDCLLSPAPLLHAAPDAPTRKWMATSGIGEGEQLTTTWAAGRANEDRTAPHPGRGQRSGDPEGCPLAEHPRQKYVQRKPAQQRSHDEKAPVTQSSPRPPIRYAWVAQLGVQPQLGPPVVRRFWHARSHRNVCPTPGISCERPICSTLVSFIPLLGRPCASYSPPRTTTLTGAASSGPRTKGAPSPIASGAALGTASS